MQRTSDVGAVAERIQDLVANGSTSLHDAIVTSLYYYRGIRGRRALVLLSDGEDTSSQFGFDRVLEEAKLSNSLIYSIGIGGSYGARKNVLKEFAEVTGGNFFFVKKATELGQVYQRIAEELGKQFYLTYSVL